MSATAPRIWVGSIARRVDLPPWPLCLQPYYSRGPIALTSTDEAWLEQEFIPSEGPSTAMASVVPRVIPRHGGMNRWTLEPLFSVVYILLVASGILAISLAAAGLDAALAAVVMILLWTAAAIVWSRTRAAKHSH